MENYHAYSLRREEWHALLLAQPRSLACTGERNCFNFREGSKIKARPAFLLTHRWMKREMITT